MATILFATSDIAGMLFPAVELARRVAAAGHVVVYASAGANARATVEANGIEFRELEPSRYERLLEVDAAVNPLSRLLRLGQRRAEALESLRPRSFAALLDELEPDLVLADGELHEEIIAALGRGAPVALLNSFVSIWRHPDLPPAHTLGSPGVGWKGSRVGMWLLWEALRWKKLRRAASLAVRRVGCDRIALLRQLAREQGLDLDRETDAGQWPMPFTWRRLPVLTMHAREIDFPHEPPGTVRHLGPLVLERRSHPAALQAAERELASIFDRCRESGRALIYAGFGSFFTTERSLLGKLFEAVAQRQDWELVVSLGGRLEPGDLGPLPERIHAFRWLPQLEVLRHADVAVIHGGITTVDECVLAGVPMLVYCGFETDMGGTTMRVVHHRLGVAGDARRDSVETIRSRIDGLLSDPGLMGRVERFRAAFAAYREGQVAESVIDSLVGGLLEIEKRA